MDYYEIDPPMDKHDATFFDKFYSLLDIKKSLIVKDMDVKDFEKIG